MHAIEEQATNVKINTNSCNAHCGKDQNILFRILPNTVFGKDNKSIRTYAFIDEGSSITLMDHEIAEELNLSGKSEPLCLKWTGDMRTTENDSKLVSIQIAGPNQRKININVHTVNKLSLPMQSLDYSKISEKYDHTKSTDSKLQ